MPKGLVIFDLDGTLARCNVSFAFSKYLFKNKKLSLLNMLVLIGINIAHKCGLCSVTSVHNIAFSCIVAKKTRSEIQNDIDTFLNNELPGLLRPELVNSLHKDTADTWLLSSSPECIVKPIASYLGIGTCFATSYEQKGDAYSKVSQIVTGDKKRAILEDYLKTSPIDRQRITAYTDSIHDLPLLEGVGHVVAVCPDFSLRRLAYQNKWDIVDLDSATF